VSGHGGDRHAATTGRYWSFFWPLTLTGLAMVLARQCQNGALGRFEDATRQLAIFAYAWSTFHLFNSPVVFVPQMTNVLARSPDARRKCLLFTVAIASALTVPVLVLAFTPVGRILLPMVFPVDEPTARTIVMYLRYLSPLILIGGLRQYLTGLLVQSRRTGLVTVLQTFSLAAILGMLILGLQLGWSAVRTLATAQVTSAAATMLATWVMERKFRRPMLAAGAGTLGYGRILRFFWPVAMTSVMFSLSRPILYSFAGSVAAGVATVAALRVAGDLAMVFQNCLNQFRHVFVTFGRGDLAGIRRFLLRVWLGVTALMVFVAVSPVSTWFFRDMLGVKPDVLPMARQVFAVLCLAPTAISIRNYFHGLAMTGHSTLAMAVGGALRVGSLYVGSLVLYHLGWLNHATAAGLLVVGFGIEAAFVIVTLLIQRKPAPPISPEAIVEDGSDE